MVANTSRAHDIDVVVSNSFAFGGNNCALVLSKEPVRRSARPAARRAVITGAGVISSVGAGRAAFIEALQSGRSGNQTSESDTHLSRTSRSAPADTKACRRLVDPAYARHLDQLGLMTLAASRLAVKDAAVNLGRGDSDRIGMIFGTCTGPLETVGKLIETIGQQGPDKVSPRLFPNSVMNAAAGHTCLSFKIKGPLSTLAIGTASGLLGLGYAADLIRSGEADVMLASAADEFTPLIHLGYEHLGLLTDDVTQPYQQQASGFVLGSGGVTLIVEDLEHARARGATVLAEVLGYASTSDAFRVAGNDPSGEALARCHQLAIADAGLLPSDVPTVYGDARGTAAIDRAEERAVAATWAPGQTSLVNLAGQVGHVHATSPMLSAVSALETIATGWRPGASPSASVRPGIAGYLGDGPGTRRDDRRWSARSTGAARTSRWSSARLSPRQRPCCTWCRTDPAGRRCRPELGDVPDLGRARLRRGPAARRRAHRGADRRPAGGDGCSGLDVRAGTSRRGAPSRWSAGRPASRG